MTMNEARELARQGKRVTRDSLRGGYMVFEDGGFWIQDPQDTDPTDFGYFINALDERATDWREWTEKDDRS